MLFRKNLTELAFEQFKQNLSICLYNLIQSIGENINDQQFLNAALYRLIINMLDKYNLDFSLIIPIFKICQKITNKYANNSKLQLQTSNNYSYELQLNYLKLLVNKIFFENFKLIENKLNNLNLQNSKAQQNKLSNLLHAKILKQQINKKSMLCRCYLDYQPIYF